MEDIIKTKAERQTELVEAQLRDRTERYNKCSTGLFISLTANVFLIILIVLNGLALHNLGI